MNIRHILAQHDLRPDKRLSQNFMVDGNALARMADSADLTSEDVVLEIGAGLGHLTRELAGHAARVVAVEVDTRLVPPLRMAMADYPNVEIVTGDMLELEPAHLIGDAPYKVVANVPYHITSALTRHLLESDHPPDLIVLTVQREVAERMAALPGDMSLLAVSVQFYGRPKVVRRLKPGAFYPRPAVESAIVRIEPHTTPLLPPGKRDDFFRIARAGFSQKRKQLKNSLAAGIDASREDIADMLDKAGIDPTRRAETLSMGEWSALYEAFASDN